MCSVAQGVWLRCPVDSIDWLQMEPTLVRLVNQHLTRVVREGSAAERAKHVPKYVQLMAALPEVLHGRRGLLCPLTTLATAGGGGELCRGRARAAESQP